MKKIIFTVITSAIFISCFKDECKSLRTIYVPVYKTLTEARAEMKSLAPQPLKSTGKLYVYGNYIFLNESDKGIHVIDNSNPASPLNISFIPMTGNQDLAVKGNFLYADSYSDLVVFDITNTTNIRAIQFLNNVFPDRNQYYWASAENPDNVLITVDYIAKDTLVTCETYSVWVNSGCINCSFDNGVPFFTATADTKNNAPNGIGGSMARFTILNDYLYTVSWSDLYAFNISNASSPALINQSSTGSWSVETIYPFKNNLFIGSQNGMYIYDVSNASTPVQIGQMSHVRTCDPVIADDNNAFVTLRSGTECFGFTNQLEILDIQNLLSPTLLQVYSMTNPHGLSKDGNTLFICDGTDGLKVYDAADINNLQLINQIKGIETYDVITLQGTALVVAKGGLYQYDYSDINNIQLISKIVIQP